MYRLGKYTVFAAAAGGNRGGDFDAVSVFLSAGGFCPFSAILIHSVRKEVFASGMMEERR